MVSNSSETIIDALPKIINNIFGLEKLEAKKFNFCYYKNGKPGSGITAERHFFKTPKADKILIDKLLENLPKTYELAFLSLITFNNHRYHIPLIDFSLEDTSGSIIKKTFSNMKKKYGGEIFIFRSGRSFHGYHNIVLSHAAWSEYIGDLLLLNKKDAVDEIIDTRWVGHCLKQGFASLRLSSQTRSYNMIPEFLMKV